MFWHDSSQRHYQGTVDYQAKENQVPKDIYAHRDWILFNTEEGNSWRQPVHDAQQGHSQEEGDYEGNGNQAQPSGINQTGQQTAANQDRTGYHSVDNQTDQDEETGYE
jgi:hypothetical protein